jgi:hypothetical protein
MTATLPTPETLRSRAAVALACAESATNTGRFTTDAARILTETQRAVALTAYARELLTIAAQLEPAPSTAAPAEVAPNDHEPVRGDVYRHRSGAEWVVVYIDGGDMILAVSEPHARPPWHVSPDFLSANFARVPS